jgi:hypothetical protein
MKIATRSTAVSRRRPRHLDSSSSSTASRPRFRAASSSASRSLALSSRRRACFCSMNRSRTSTRSCATICVSRLPDCINEYVRFFGRDVTRLPAENRARLGMGYIPQGRHVFPRMTVEENLEVGRHIGGPGGKKLPKLVFESFPRLKERRNQIAGIMSGGSNSSLRSDAR